MELSKLYDRISKDYADAGKSSSNLIAHCLDQGVAALKNANIAHETPWNVLDLGAGDGKFLERIQEWQPSASLTALDASQGMLDNIQKNLSNIKIVCAPLQNASQLLPKAQFNLMLSSFVCSYVGLDEILRQINNLLRPGGTFCIITTTMESFREIQDQINVMKRHLNPAKRLFGHWALGAISKTLVPKNQQEIRNKFFEHDLELVNMIDIRKPVRADTPNTLIDFAVHGGWAISLLDTKWIPQSAHNLTTQLASSLFTFPINDHLVVACAVGRKPKAD